MSAPQPVVLVHGAGSTHRHNWGGSGWTSAGNDRAAVAALPDARLVTLTGLDHFATTSDVRAMEAATRFLDEA